MITTAETIVNKKVAIVKKCIKTSLRSVKLRMFVRANFRDVSPGDYIRKLWQLQSQFRFIPENKGDYCQDVDEFLTKGYGDCEDFAVLNTCIAKLLGIPSRIKVTETKGNGYYTHIYIEVYDPRTLRYIPFDGTYRIKGIGGEPSYRKFRIYDKG